METQEKQSYLRRLPDSASAFINRVIKKMRYRKKVRSEVMAELAAHFEDELKDCTTDEQKQKKAQQLITGFGDVTLLAVLLRRSKKRCRPLWRTIVARTFQAIGVLILCLVLYAVWFSTGQPTISVDYLALLNQMNRPEVRDEDNAWPHYEKAIELYVDSVPGGIAREFISYRYSGKRREEVLWLKGLIEDHRQEISGWLGQNQKHWDNLNSQQQAVILKCFECNYIPFFKKFGPVYGEWWSTRFNTMIEHILESIREKKELTTSIPGGGILGLQSLGFPEKELKGWLNLRRIPPNFLEAVSVAVLHEAVKRYENPPEDIYAPLTDVEYEYISPWVRQNEPAWREFVAGSSKSYCYRPYEYAPNDEDKLLWSVNQLHLAILRRLAWLGIWCSRIHVKEEHILQGLEDCLVVARAGSHWQRNGTIVEQLVGLSISALAHKEILHIAAAQNLSVAELKQFQQQLSQIYPEAYPLMDIEGERMAFLDVVQRFFTEGGLGGGHLIPAQWDKFKNPMGLDKNERKLFMQFYTAASMVHARRDETIAKANQIYDHLSRIIKTTPFERHTSGQKTAYEMLLSMPKYKFFLIDICIPAGGRASEIVYRGKVLHEATVAIFALERWRLEKNEYPTGLDELVSAAFLKELPMDPYSDKPLVYKCIDNDFMLYSLGVDFVDDGGKPGRDSKGRFKLWMDDGDAVFWPVPKTDIKQ